jgi:hypothetical protein
MGASYPIGTIPAGDSATVAAVRADSVVGVDHALGEYGY